MRKSKEASVGDTGNSHGDLLSVFYHDILTDDSEVSVLPISFKFQPPSSNQQSLPFAAPSSSLLPPSSASFSSLPSPTHHQAHHPTPLPYPIASLPEHVLRRDARRQSQQLSKQTTLESTRKQALPIKKDEISSDYVKKETLKSAYSGMIPCRLRLCRACVPVQRRKKHEPVSALTNIVNWNCLLETSEK
jgi:hypothetical protein